MYKEGNNNMRYDRQNDRIRSESIFKEDREKSLILLPSLINCGLE